MKRDDRQKLIGGPAPPMKRRGLSFVSAFWVLSTFVVIACLVVAAGFPNWIVNRVDGAPNSAQSRDLNADYSALVRVDLGLYYLCYQLYSGRPECGMDNSCKGICSTLGYCGCVTYLSYNPPANFITAGGESTTAASSVYGTQSAMDFVWLFAASIIYAFGVLMLLLSLVVGTLALCKPRCGGCSLFLTAFTFQIIAGAVLVVSFFLIPLFFGSDFAKQFCGSQVNYYQKGQCTIDWSLYMGMVVSACSLYLPAIAVFALNISDGVKAPVCC